MSDSDTECDDGSSDELTPIMPSQHYSKACNFEAQEAASHLRNLSQQDSILPASSHREQRSSKREVAMPPVMSVLPPITPPSIPQGRRSYLLIPPQAASAPKAVIRPQLSDEEQRVEAIRIIKTLPRGEITMWVLMQNIEFQEMRSLCRYKGLKLSSKAEMGHRILQSIKKGEFRSIFRLIEDEKKGVKNYSGMGKNQSQLEKRPESAKTELKSKDSEDNKINKSHHQDQKFPERSVVNLFAPFKAAPTPVVAVGSNNNWKMTDNRESCTRCQIELLCR